MTDHSDAVKLKHWSVLDFFSLRTGFAGFFAVDFGYAKEMGQSLFQTSPPLSGLRGIRVS
jgi:hypothetical protein